MNHHHFNQGLDLSAAGLIISRKVACIQPRSNKAACGFAGCRLHDASVKSVGHMSPGYEIDVYSLLGIQPNF